MRLVLLFCLALTACSRPDARPRVRIAALGGAIGQLSIYMAHSLGYFADEGLDVELEELTSTAKTMEAVMGGSIDVGGSTYEQILQIVAAGGSVQSFFLLNYGPTQVLAVSPTRPSIRQIGDLKGKNVGVTSLNSSTQHVLSRLLVLHGMAADDATPVSIGSAATAVAAVEQGKVDAALLISLTYEILRTRNRGVTVLFDSRTAEGTRQVYGAPRIAGAAAVASPQWLAAHRNEARRIARALSRAARWIHEQPIAEVRAKLPDSLRTPGSDADLHSLEISIPGLTPDGRMPPGGPAATLGFIRNVADPSLSVDLSRTYTEEFLEPAP